MNNSTNKYAIYALVSLIFFQACTFTHLKQEFSEEEIFYQKINSYGIKYYSYVELLDDEEFFGEHLTITSDSTSWISPEDNTKMVIENSKIHKIVFQDHLKGAIGGMALFLIIGVITSFAIIATDPFEGDGNDMKNLKFFISTSTLFLLSGAVVGGIKSEKTIFIINEKESQ